MSQVPPTTQTGEQFQTQAQTQMGQKTGTATGATGQQGVSQQPQMQQMQQKQPRTFATRNYLPEHVRQTINERLNRCLADSTVLLSQVKNAHWNVKGMQFFALHELFDEIVEEFDDHIDDIGERISALGGEAFGTVHTATGMTTIPPLPSGLVTGKEYVGAIADRLAIHDANLSQDITAATQAGDLDTADLLNEVSREVAEQLWFLEAHLQGTQQQQQQQQQLQQQPQPKQQQQYAGGGTKQTAQQHGFSENQSY